MFDLLTDRSIHHLLRIFLSHIFNIGSDFTVEFRCIFTIIQSCRFITFLCSTEECNAIVLICIEFFTRKTIRIWIPELYIGIRIRNNSSIYFIMLPDNYILRRNDKDIARRIIPSHQICHDRIFRWSHINDLTQVSKMKYNDIHVIVSIELLKELYFACIDLIEIFSIFRFDNLTQMKIHEICSVGNFTRTNGYQKSIVIIDECFGSIRLSEKINIDTTFGKIIIGMKNCFRIICLRSKNHLPICIIRNKSLNDIGIETIFIIWNNDQIRKVFKRNNSNTNKELIPDKEVHTSLEDISVFVCIHHREDSILPIE